MAAKWATLNSPIERSDEVEGAHVFEFTVKNQKTFLSRNNSQLSSLFIPIK